MSWENPHAWRDGYDEWKTRSPDWYDDEDSDEDRDREDMASYMREHAAPPRRWRLISEAARAAQGNPAALVARRLANSRRHMRGALVYAAIQPPTFVLPRRRSLGFALADVAAARAVRLFIGPPCPDDMIPF